DRQQADVLLQQRMPNRLLLPFASNQCPGLFRQSLRPPFPSRQRASSALARVRGCQADLVDDVEAAAPRRLGWPCVLHVVARPPAVNTPASPASGAAARAARASQMGKMRNLYGFLPNNRVQTPSRSR